MFTEPSIAERTPAVQTLLANPVNNPAPLAAFLAHLWRGGAWAYWNADRKRSSWFPIAAPWLPIPRRRADLYFGVHPMRCIPPTNAEGKQVAQEWRRGQYKYLAAVNCLYGEFDAKDFPGGKAEALEHVQALPLRPSVLVDSGGGYHAYWLLRDPFTINTDADLEHVKGIQRRWVAFVGGDPEAKDLTRILRIPGTRNYKPKYGHDGAPVAFVWVEMGRQYDLAALAALLPAEAAPATVTTVTPMHRPIGGSRAERYAQGAHRRQLDTLARAPVGRRNGTLNRAAHALGQFVGAGLLDENTVTNDLQRLAELRGLRAGDVARTIQSGLAAGLKIAPKLPEEDTPPDDPTPPTDGTAPTTNGWDQLAATKARAHAARLAIGKQEGKQGLRDAGLRPGDGMLRTIDAMLEEAEKTGRTVIAPGLHALAEKAGSSRPTVNRHLADIFPTGLIDLSRDVQADGPRTPWRIDLSPLISSLVKSETQKLTIPEGCVSLLTSDADAGLGWYTNHRADDAFTPYPLRYVLRRGLRADAENPPIVPPVFLRNLPPMARQVWRGLLEHGELSIAGMVEELGIGQSSARNVCRRMEEDGYVVAVAQGRAHEKVYRLVEDADAHLDAARPHMQSFGVHHRREIARALEMGLSAESGQKAADDARDAVAWQEYGAQAGRARNKLLRLVDEARRAGVNYRVAVWRKANAWLRYDHAELERENRAALDAWKGTAGADEADRRRMMLDAGFTMPDIWNAKRLALPAAD